jgi:hypothetical protein
VSTVDERLLDQARQAQERLVRAENEAGVARILFHRAVRVLVSRGAPPADVAAALGLSDQQVDEIAQPTRGSGEGREKMTADLLACSFCGRTQRQVSKLIAGPGVYVCDLCIELAADVVSSGAPADTQLGTIHAVPGQDRRVDCSFCGKKRHQVTAMAARVAAAGGETPGRAAICDECLSLCDEILTEELT